MSIVPFSMGTLYSQYPSLMNSNFGALATLCKDQPTGDMLNQIRYSSGSSKLEYWNSSAWVTLPLIASSIPAANVTSGAMTMASYNKVNITAPSSSATLTLANGSTLATVGAFSLTMTVTASTSVTFPTSGTLSTLGANTFTGTQTFKGICETRTVMAATTIDLSAGTYFTKTISGNTTFTVSSVPSAGLVGSFVLIITGGGSYTISWWSGVKWAAGQAPVLSTGKDMLSFTTEDGGTTWIGVLVAKDIK